MSLAPLLAEPWPIVLHAALAAAAALIAVRQFAMPKGTRGHRAAGWLWVALMAGVAAGSFAIHTIRQVGPFSAIHLVSAYTLVMLWLAVAHARAGRVRPHATAMTLLAALALGVTGALTLWPGRAMHAVVFGG